MTADRARMLAAFEAADDYDRHAGVQQAVAAWLAERIAATGPHPCVLELGCGTGLLTAAALEASKADDWLATDLAPAMVARTRARFGQGRPVRTAVVDGAAPPLDGSFDLVCSSLVAQWFDDLPAALARQWRLVAPGGRLMLTTLGSNSFAGWRRAVAAAGGQAGTRGYPSLEELAQLRLPGGDLRIEARLFSAGPASALELLRSVKRIGAGTPAAGSRPLTPAVLRGAAQHFDAAGGTLEYEVALIEVQRRSRS